MVEDIKRYSQNGGPSLIKSVAINGDNIDKYAHYGVALSNGRFLYH